MVKMYSDGGSWEFEPGQEEPPKFTPGDAPTAESIAEKIENINIEIAKDKLKD